MYELIPVTDRCYYIDAPAKIGLCKLSDTQVILVDGGSDKDAGRKIRQHLEANHWTLTAIYATHSHADHIGGCKYLQGQTGCAVYAPGVESAVTCHPILEPSMLYGGFPPKELRNKFLMAQGCLCQELTPQSLPQGFSLVSLPGHCLDMVGIRTPENVVFLADSLASRETLEKYQITFLYDVAAYLNTLEAVKQMSAHWFIPAHATPTQDIAPLAQLNIDKTMEISRCILSLCQSSVSFECLLTRLFDSYRLTMSFQQYALVGSTVKSYLAWLKDQGKVEIQLRENALLWCAV